MKVYILESYASIPQEDPPMQEIIGVFSTKEKAIEKMNYEAEFLIKHHNRDFNQSENSISGTSGHTYFSYDITEHEVL